MLPKTAHAPILGIIVALAAAPPASAAAPAIEIWHGDTQRIGHLGVAQPDFNLMGHVGPWRDLESLQWRLNRSTPVPLSFRAFRRLAADGDFNADIPIALLKPGANTVEIAAVFRDGQTATRTVELQRLAGSRPLPVHIQWKDTENPQDAGQYVDGAWQRTPGGLRAVRPGYDRLFLVGAADWRDYAVLTDFTVHAVNPVPPPSHGGAGVGVILRFAGHVTGGPLHFPSGQPKWGYQPFGAIGWLRWEKREAGSPVRVQYFPGDTPRAIDHAVVPFEPGARYRILMTCETRPESRTELGVTRYRCKIWPAADPEPAAWSWEHTQVSAIALQAGGAALVAHHVDVTFGDVSIMPLGSGRDTEP